VTISSEAIKQLRELTGAGVLDCKKTLEEYNGDMDKAAEHLRKKGIAAAAKKESREANNGLVGAQLSADGKLAVMVEVNCETDFVARTEDFKNFVDGLVRQVTQQSLYKVEDLLTAPYIDNPGKSVKEQVTDLIAKLGENMLVRRIARFELQGDGMLDSYIHYANFGTDPRVGVLIEVGGGSPTNDKFAALVHDLALQIAASGPSYVSAQDIPADALAAKKTAFLDELADDKKPENIKERIIEGKLQKWYGEVVLLNQVFVKDQELTVAQLLQNISKELGAQLTVRRFARFERGV
jgi:elongation factor Ts